MADLSTKFASKAQDWVTPDDLFVPLHREFGFTLDAAASPDNAKASKFFTREKNGLRQDWGSEIVWLNPPYGDTASPLGKWVAKCKAAAERGALVVALIPARTNTNWFHDICLKVAEVRFLRGRPRFNGAPHGLPQPLCVVVFRPKQEQADALL